MGTMQRIALVSVSDKRGVAEFAQRLVGCGFTVLSTGGTAKALQAAKVPVTLVSDFTGAPEILGGRVKTLHPMIHGGILAKSGEGHTQELAKVGGHLIELVCVNLYPFEETIAKDGVTMDTALENIDIGGPTMVRAAAKNWPRVTVVCNPDNYERVAQAIENDDVTAALREELAGLAFAHTAHYDTAIASYMGSYSALELTSPKPLRYGENPHQEATLFSTSNEDTLANAVPIHGKALSYNNYMDLDAALGCCREFSAPTAVVVKHMNPCGVASADSLAEAYTQARATDPTSAFGSIVALNRVVDKDTANLCIETFLECIVAPGFSHEAEEILKAKKNLRLLKVQFSQPNIAPSVRSIDGGVLIQDADTIATTKDAKVATKRKPTEEESLSLEFAWAVAKHVKSNAIIYCRGTRTVGIGAGQMSRIDSSMLGVRKANEPVKGCVAASDAFFPFRDGLDTLAEAGVTAVVQPGGSKRDGEVIDAANEHGLAMIFTGRRHFRH